MRKILLCGAAALILASCGEKPQASQQEINAALDQMALSQSGEGRTDFVGKNLKGDEVVFKDVTIRTSELSDNFNTALEGDKETDPETDAQMSDLKAGTMVFKGLKLDKESGNAVFSRMTLGQLSVIDKESPDSEVSAGEISVSNPTPELAAWITGLLGKGDKVDPPEPAAVGFDNFSLTDLMIKSTDANEPVEMGVGNVSVENYRDFKAGKFSLADVNFAFTDPDNGNQGTFSLGNMSLNGADMKFLRAFEEEGEEAIAEKLTELAYANPIDPGFDSFSLSKLNFSMEGVNFDLPELAYNVDRNKNGVPVSFDMPEFTATLDASSEGGTLGMQLAPVMAMLGFEQVKLSMAGKSTYDPKTDISTSETSYMQVDNAFRLSSTGVIGGLSKIGEAMQGMDSEAFADGEQDPAEMMMDIYSKLDFHNLSVSLQDQGIVDKAFAIAAAQQGQDPEEMKAQVIGMSAALPFFAQSLGIDAAIATEFSTAATGFLKDGGTLTVTVNPETPLKLTDLMSDPTQLTKENLGFSATLK